MKSRLYPILLILVAMKLNAQIEDISSGFKSSSSGLQILSITESEKDSILTPVTGTLIFQTTTPKGLYYYMDSNWVKAVEINEIQNLTTVIRKYQDQEATNEDTLVMDSSFVFELDSNAHYQIEASLEFEELGSADAKVGWNYSGVISEITYGFPGITVSGAHITALDPSNKIPIASSTRTEYLKGYISTNSSGTLTFMYAPFDDGSGTKTLSLKADSFMFLRKI
jgi:hypothetical protein